ncbi:putative Glycosyl transferase group 1 [Acidobacteriia bacterium SbA2]|nr:putative Glycosyl transferase group 1 [Acidobacteriia bacterium SbA2]
MTSPRPLKIAHIDLGESLRGGQRQLLNLARGLRERGYCQIVVCREESELEACARKEEFPRFSLPGHDIFHMYGVLLLRHMLRAAPCDVLHAHDGHGQTVSWMASAGLPVRRVASRRVAFLPSEGQRWTYSLKYAHTSDAVIAVSDFIRQGAIRCGLPDSMIEVIPDGIEFPAESPSNETRAKARAGWGATRSEFLIGHLGAFTHEKGQDVALQALQILKQSLPQARLLLAGDGPALSNPGMARRYAALGERVRLCGTIHDLREFFSALDLFIMPSKSEGLGSSALMAMSYGLPVVASRVGGLPEVVEEGRTGWLIEPGSPGALAEAIIAAAADRARLQQWGLNGRERARRFTVDIMVQRTEALYRRLLAG